MHPLKITSQESSNSERKMKVICAGYPKTGTKSILKALRILGYHSHDVMDHYSLHLDDYIDLFEGRCPEGDSERLRTMYADVDAVVEVPANMLWYKLVEAFPDAKQHTFDQARLATVTPTRPVTVDDQSPNKDDEVVVLDSSEEESVVTSQKQQRKRPRDNQTQQQKQWGDFALPQKKVATVEIDDTDDILSTFCEE